MLDQARAQSQVEVDRAITQEREVLRSSTSLLEGRNSTLENEIAALKQDLAKERNRLSYMQADHEKETAEM